VVLYLFFLYLLVKIHALSYSLLELTEPLKISYNLV
jgi:hypothetical protein